MACPEMAIFGLFWRSGEEGLGRPKKLFWLNPITLVPATLPKHKIADKHLRLNLNPGTWVKVIVLWLQLVLRVLVGLKVEPVLPDW